MRLSWSPETPKVPGGPLTPITTSVVVYDDRGSATFCSMLIEITVTAAFPEVFTYYAVCPPGAQAALVTKYTNRGCAGRFPHDWGTSVAPIGGFWDPYDVAPTGVCPLYDESDYHRLVELHETDLALAAYLDLGEWRPVASPSFSTANRLVLLPVTSAVSGAAAVLVLPAKGLSGDVVTNPVPVALTSSLSIGYIYVNYGLVYGGDGNGSLWAFTDVPCHPSAAPLVGLAIHHQHGKGTLAASGGGASTLHALVTAAALTATVALTPVLRR